MKPEEGLSIKWSKKENDHVFSYPRKCDGALIAHHILSDVLRWGGLGSSKREPLNYERFNLLEELDKRGYDITTLQFSIKLKDKQ